MFPPKPDIQTYRQTDIQTDISFATKNNTSLCLCNNKGSTRTTEAQLSKIT